MMSELGREIERLFAQCGVFFRDTRLPIGLLARYQPGVLLWEPTFCDSTWLPGGFVAPHRYLIFSSDARELPGSPSGWGMCLWPRGRIFKVLDQTGDGQRVQVTLLEIPAHVLEVFLGSALGDSIEEQYAAHGRDLFTELRNAPPIPELDSDAWRDRLVYPVGLDDRGDYFPLFRDEDHTVSEARLRTARAVQYQAQLLLGLGSYEAADKQVRPAIEALRPYAQDSPLAVALLLVSQADLATQLGDYAAAERTLHEAFRLAKSGGDDRLAVASILSRLGHLYQAAGADHAAKRFYLHALAIRRTSAGEQSSEVVTTLAALEEREGGFAEAQKHLDEALAIATELGDAEDPVLLNNLGRLQQARGEFEEAARTFRRALASPRVEQTVARLPVVANLAEVLVASGDATAGLRLLNEVLDAQQTVITQIARTATAERLTAASSVARSQLRQYASLVVSQFSAEPDEVRRLADRVVDSKASTIDVLAARREILVRGRNPRLRAMLDELTEVRASVARLRLDGPDPTHPRAFYEALTTASARLSEMEAELAGRTAELTPPGQISVVDAATVARYTPKSAVTIEFLRYDTFDFHAVRASAGQPWAGSRYLAIVLAPATPDRPTLVDLGDADTIDTLVAEVRCHITGRLEVISARSAKPDRVVKPAEARADAAERLYVAVIAPLLPAIGKARRILLAPDGDLLRLPFEVLPTPDGGQLIDAYTISYLTAARDLLRRPAPSPVDPPLVVAAPDYDLGATAPLGQPFPPLPAARHEGHDIAGMLGVPPHRDADATKATIMRTHAPRILHIAAHGFALTRQPPLRPDEFTVGSTVRMADAGREAIVLDGILATPAAMVATGDQEFGRLSGQHITDPLLRAGLALAGANTWLHGGEPPPAAGNGILTAWEITGLDLDGTELVVLSACDSGLGDVHHTEGILGLRRAFVLAGARTLITSLWRVPDDSTHELMRTLYHLVGQGRTPAQALREAQLRLRRTYPHPRFWAGFICHGDQAITTAESTHDH